MGKHKKKCTTVMTAQLGHYPGPCKEAKYICKYCDKSFCDQCMDLCCRKCYSQISCQTCKYKRRAEKMEIIKRKNGEYTNKDYFGYFEYCSKCQRKVDAGLSAIRQTMV